MRAHFRARWTGHAFAALAISAGAAAQETREPAPPAFLLRIDGPDAYFDLGRAQGAAPGDRVRVLRSVRALHPVTHAPIEDRFVIGELQIAEAGAALSRARPDPELLRGLVVGDRVELARQSFEPRVPVARVEVFPDDPTALKSAPACEPGQPAKPSPEGQDALGFREAWMTAQGLSPSVRAHHWKKWLQAHPKTAVASAVAREIAALRAEAEKPLIEEKPPPPPLASGSVIVPSRAYAGDPLEAVLSLGEGTRPRSALLGWRARGEPVFHQLAFAEGPDRSWRARLPATASREPGVDWYAELVGPAGDEHTVAGQPAAPRTIDVQRPPGVDEEGAHRERSRTGLWVDFVDWNHLKGNDQYWNVEGEFLYRVLGPVYSVRMGFGVYQGYGESLSDSLADERAAASGEVNYRKTRVGYNYGFTELEFHPAEWLGLMTKVLSGVNRGGFLMGINGSVRIGREQGTSLLLSTGFTPGIGNRNEISLAWDQVTGFPMAASVIVSNEPVQADYGVRFVYQIGRRLNDVLDLSLRASYQLRDINHNGFGLGLAQTFHW